MPDIHERFAEGLRELREERRLSQSQLARRMQEIGIPMDRVAITKIEQAAIESESARKPRKVTIDEALGFAAVLGVSLDVLISQEETRAPAEPLTREHFDKRMERLDVTIELLFEQIAVLQAPLEQGSEVEQ